MTIKRTTVVLPEELKKKLKHIGADYDVSMTMVIMTAIYHFLKDYDEGKIDGSIFSEVREYIKRVKSDASFDA